LIKGLKKIAYLYEFYKMEINYKLIDNLLDNTQILFSSLILLIFLLILVLRFFYPKRYILNVYKPNVYMFEYEAKQKNYFSFYVLVGSLLNYLILFFILLNLSLHIKKSKIDPYIMVNLILIVLGIFLYKNLMDFIFVLFIKKPSLFSSLRFIRISFENHLYFFLYFIGFFMLFYNYKNSILFYINALFLILFLIYSLTNFYISLGKHIHLKSSKIILYLCISEILPIIFIIYWLSFQLV